MSARDSMTDPGTARRGWVGCAAALAGVLAGTGMMQQGARPVPQPLPQEGRPIQRIEFIGLTHVAETYARALLKLKPGDPYDRRPVEDDITRLIKSGKFDDVRAEPRIEQDALILVFRVVERPFVEAVEFSGNRKFKARDLQAEVELSPGAPISEFALTQAVANIERKYKEAGYYYVEVTVDRERLPDRIVRFSISEGPRVRVRRILFEGNASIPAARLQEKLETTTYLWIFRTGDFDEDRAERDAASLQNYYKDRGFLDARAGYQLEFDPTGRDLAVTFVIDEGPQYLVRELNFRGNAVFTSEELALALRLHPDAVFDADVLKDDVRRLVERYGALGYIYADVRTDWAYARDPGFVDLTLTISEREQFRFGRIVIRGNSRTQDKVVRRELRFFPEEVYDATAVRRAEQRLVETRLFTEATITPVGNQPGVRDALVRIEEADATTVLFGVGVTSNSGLVGSISIENRNFDLFDRPRDAREFFKGRAFRGAGQTLRLLVEPGTEFTRARLDFREPYLLDQNLGFGTGVYLFERDRGEWDERRIGFNVSFDHRFRQGWLDNWAAEAAFRFENVNIGDTDWLTAKRIRDDRGDHWLTSVKGTLVRDTTDSRFLPTRGNRLTVSWEQAGALGGDFSFGKLIADAAQHYTLHTDSSDRKHVLSLSGTLGNIFGYAPVFERFFGGGIGSIRGFEFRGVSPRAGWREDRVGGDFQLLTNAEYSFPLVGTSVRGVAFVDMGTVEENFEINAWRASVGLGARIYIKFFGPIPLAFDFAWPVAKEDEDDTQVFSFSFGTTF